MLIELVTGFQLAVTLNHLVHDIWSDGGFGAPSTPDQLPLDVSMDKHKYSYLNLPLLQGEIFGIAYT